MNLVSLGIGIALLATLFSLVAGVASMANHGQALHHTSEEWMILRVAFQAVAVVLLLVLVALPS
jgi:hypothetical protein